MKMSKVKISAGLASFGLLLGATYATAVTVAPASSTGHSQVFESPAPEPTPAPVVEAVPAPAPAPVLEAPAPVAPPVEVPPVVAEQPKVEPRPATVEAVTEDAPVAAPRPAPAAPDRSIGTTGPDGRYRPAPPVINEGEPPLADNWDQLPAPAEPLPGEPGYVQPAPAQ